MSRITLLLISLLASSFATALKTPRFDAEEGDGVHRRRLQNSVTVSIVDACTGGGPCVIEQGTTAVVDRNVHIESLTVHGTLRPSSHRRRAHR